MLIRIRNYRADAFVKFDGSEMVVSDRFVMFWRPPNPFCQWTPSPFVIDGIRYRCAEQYMMAEKARLFGDKVMESEIMAAESPREHQKLGKRVSGFHQKQWDIERTHIVFRGNLAKFTQNSELLHTLKDTGDRTLVEASPYDTIWGIGYAASHPHAYDPSKWRGKNLLGKVLSDVRAAVMA